MFEEGDKKYYCPICQMPHFSKEEAEECARTPVPDHTFKIGDRVPLEKLGFQEVLVTALLQMPASKTHERFILLGTTPEPQAITEETARKFIAEAQRRRSE